MQNVLNLNKIILSFLLVIHFSGCTLSNDKSDKKSEKIDQIYPLVIALNFNDFSTLKFKKDSLNWNSVCLDSSLSLSIKSSKHFDSILNLKINLIAIKIPFLFQLKKIGTSKIAFIAVQQHNTIHSDSINFVIDNQRNLKLDNAYHIINAKDGIDQIIPISIIKLKNTIDVTKLDFKKSFFVNRNN